MRHPYYSCVSYTDAQIGKVISELEKQGFADDIIIVLWADHGWLLGKHNKWCKHTNFEDAIHVPFLVHVAGVINIGMHTKALVELTDIFSSLTELSGIPTPPISSDNNKLHTCVDSNSVEPLLSNPDQQWNKGAFTQYPRPAAGLKDIPGHPPFSPNEHSKNVMGYTISVDKYHFTE